MRRFTAPLAALAAAALAAAACDSSQQAEPITSRFAAVEKVAHRGSDTGFCEKQWPAASRKFVAIPERPLPAASTRGDAGGKSWKWVNLWATWCLPCVEEMGLLARWRSSLEKDGIPLDLELWSVDEDQTKLVEYLQSTGVPGRVRWLRAPEDLPAVLESLGADRAAAIPVHALVDGDGNLRCLRVGSIHEEDYGAVKALLTS